MGDAKAASLRLRLAEGRLKRALELAKSVGTDPSKRNLFHATVRDLPEIKRNFESDHITVEMAAEQLTDFDNDSHAARMQKFEDQYYDVMATVESLTNKLEAAQAGPINTRKVNVILPKISLPQFNGNAKDWVNFSNLFSALVADHPDLTPIERLSYLKLSLNGEPLSMIQALPMSDENFKVAWKLLSERYSNKRLIVSLHVEALLDAPTVSSDSPTSLRKMLTIITENMAALEALKVPVQHWDLILLPILCKKLDTILQTQWEMVSSDTDLPTCKFFVQFLEKHCRAMEAVASTRPASAKMKPLQTSADRKLVKGYHSPNVFMVKPNLSCNLCNAAHLLCKCPQFQERPHRERFALVKELNLCLNCLQPSHQCKNCPSAFSCRHCKSRHHSLLHFPEPSTRKDGSAESGQPVDLPHSSNGDKGSTVTVCSSFSRTPSSAVVMLSTAVIDVQDVSGATQPIRVLLDSGSQANFISEDCLSRLGIPRRKKAQPLQGLSQAPLNIARGVVSCVLKPCGQTGLVFSIDALVLPHITGHLPSAPVDSQTWSHLAHLQLADPAFANPGSVDMLLGAELFPYLLKGSKCEGPPGTPVALDTHFGWIVMGKVDGSLSNLQSSNISSFFVASSSLKPPLTAVVERLWELEELPHDKPTPSPEDVLCEKLFVEGYVRDETGRYSVSLTFKKPDPDLGDSYSTALRRFHSLERRFKRQPELKRDYVSFMQDYISSGHMSCVENLNVNSCRSYYIPHHCVHKLDSTTTKLRVVFDASAKASSGLSLNDALLTGPKLQRDIVEVLLQFRIPLIVFTGDIKQMYRQIMVADAHRDYQRILWRESEDQPLEVYRLNTVTYGVSSAPFLALRALHQLAADEQEVYTNAARVLLSDTYVDDVVTGTSDVTSAVRLRKELQQLLSRGGFQLRKFTSNCPAVLEGLGTEDGQLSSTCYSFDEDQYVKILGLRWNPSTDTFSYDIQQKPPVLTKRGILSDIARVFDPLGWLSPLTLLAKHLIQQLWLASVDWDCPAPADIIAKWETIRNELCCCSHITIPRCITVRNADSTFELHGFSDSSEKGYGTVVYLRQVSCTSVVTTHLLLAKCKVAPLKRITLPRLELCAAVLLARCLHLLLKKYSSSLPIEEIYAWTDSSVTLSWIKASPHVWKTFVGNRVSEIQSYTSTDWWHHVPSEQNPADCASRGLTPAQLIKHSLWWSGPTWLCEDKKHWPQSIPHGTNLTCTEERRTIVLQATLTHSPFLDLMERQSKLNKVKRIIALCCRFGQAIGAGRPPITGPVQFDEMQRALNILIKISQREFSEEFVCIARNQPCSSAIQKLAPFVDSEGFLRVGGRLQRAELQFKEKHPILLPKNCRLAVLLIDELHLRFFHPGSQMLQSLLQREFWVLGARNLIRSRLHKCIRCFRAHPKHHTPTMGCLPAERVRQAKPFMNTGVDYGGPISITMARVKRPRVLQAYICLFVCFATKAIHLELASDLSTEAFLAAFRRFLARRGQCANMYSDCGTNFVGASHHLEEVQTFLADSDTRKQIVDSLTEHKITWHFNPPAAPHFGGLWEAGIKSVKSILKKVVGIQLLTYEELSTVLAQIEATLNSRPLCPLSSDPNDLSALTPSHFLTMGPAQILPELDVSSTPSNRLTRWSLLQQIHQSFWKRWHVEYLHHLQPKVKWNVGQKTLAEGSLVLVKDPNLPPLRWKLGRIVKIHPGADGVVRVVDVRTQLGTFTRPAVKLCPLPLN